MSAFVITEMCPDGRMPPLSVPTDAELTVRAEAADHAFVVADERSAHPGRREVRIAGPPLEFLAALGKLSLTAARPGTPRFAPCLAALFGRRSASLVLLP